MDFFERQARAQKKTSLLVFYFVMAVLGIIAVLQVIFAYIMSVSFFDPSLAGMVAAGVVVVVGLGSLVKIIELSQGGRVVAAMLGGEPVTPNTTDLNQKKLLNIVEEMAIASGVPAPEVYLLPDETINAFAAGHGPGDTAIGVTRGCIEKLSRDELQGVIAHEFSHILHGDMKLNLRLIGLLNGILGLALLGGILMRSTLYMRDSRDRNSGGLVAALVAAGIALYLVGWIGVLFGNLIKAAVSRQREFLADASAVQFTRNPSGIAGALSKIGAFQSKLSSPRAEEASHLYFGNGLNEHWFSLFATHPPLEERIKAIDPNFQPSELEESAEPPPLPTQSTPPPLPKTMDPAAFVAAVIPLISEETVRDLHGACAFVYAMLLDEREEIRELQLKGLDVEDSIRREMFQLLGRRTEIPIGRRLPLIDLAIPTLRHLSSRQYAAFRANVVHLVEADRQIHLFEFALQKTLLRHLDLYFTNSTGTPVKFSSIDPLLPDVAVLLSGLAFVGHSNAAERQEVFAAGLAKLPPAGANLARRDACDLSAIDAALDRLAQASPLVKRTVLDACRETVTHDGIVDSQQFELLRAIADTLDCPLPPLPPVTE